jgi:hypothetical protein
MQQLQGMPSDLLVWRQAFPALTQQSIVYRANGQSLQTKNADTAECQLRVTGSAPLMFVNCDDVFVAFGNCLAP